MLIQPYHKSWEKDFILIKEIIIDLLGESYLEIEHIGSTAVPGLAAKPIIDIDLVYHQIDEFDKIKEGLESLGYYHNGNQGIPQREVFKRNKKSHYHEVLDGIDHHLYVCPANSPELKRHLLFRDYLRTHDDVREEYEDLKYEIARIAQQDKKVYAKLKEEMAREFIGEILMNCES